MLLDFPNPADPDVVHIGTLAGDLFLEKEADLRRYQLLFEHLRAVASSPDQTASSCGDTLIGIYWGIFGQR